MGKIDPIESIIGRIIRNAPEFHVQIESNPSEKWFVLHNAHLAPCYSSATCDIMVRFKPDNRMSIFVPKHIGLNLMIEPCMCPLFLSKNLFMHGWRQVCPNLTEGISGLFFENIAVLLQFIQNPTLCGIHGCDERVAYEKLVADFEYELLSDNDETEI